jgi:hypothetical protein
MNGVCKSVYRYGKSQIMYDMVKEMDENQQRKCMGNVMVCMRNEVLDSFGH